MSTKASILFIGDQNHPEFSVVATWLATRGATIKNDVANALSCLQAGFIPSVIVVAQPWPGHVSTKQIELLRRTTPLAHLVSLLGTWLEGESRTGTPWPAVWRTYWHHWLPRFAEQLDRFEAGTDSVWSLPAMVSDEERLLHLSNTQPFNSSPLTKTVVLISSHRETADSLADVCHGRNWQTVWIKSATEKLPKNIDLVLLDLEKQSAAKVIPNLKSQIGKTPILALASFPRIDDIRQVQELGEISVVAKPFLITELTRQMESVFKNN